MSLIIPPLLCLVSGYYFAFASLVWGKFRRESFYIALLCVWWTLLCYAFIYHQLESDTVKIMRLERVIHTLFVFRPVVSLIYCNVMTGERRKRLTALTVLMSIAFAITVHTEYYFYDFYHYSWGMIAKGGIAFKIFSLYGLAMMIYLLYDLIKKIIYEKNEVRKLKYKYVFAAYFLSSLLLLSNIPAMNGISFYPLSNLEFIPLGILSYGSVRYRFLKLKSIFPKLLFWAVFTSTMLVPNIFIFFFIRKNSANFGDPAMAGIYFLWFIMNYFYSIKIQPLINHLINRRYSNLNTIRNVFINDIAVLMNLDELVKEMESVIRKALSVDSVRLYVKRGGRGYLTGNRGEVLSLNRGEEELLSGMKFIEKSIVETGEHKSETSSMLLRLFDFSQSDYLFPLVHNNEFIAVIALRQKISSGRLDGNELKFIMNINSYATIALANSVVYQNLADIKDNLEEMVIERTSVIEQQRQNMENDIQLARKIQSSLLPAEIPENERLVVAYKYEPILAIGGDFIDFHYRKGMNEFGIFICDVSGHGTSSAMISAMIKMSLNSWGRYITSPAGIFRRLRELLMGKIGDNFITAFVCSIDMNSGEIISACAGHPPMVIIRSGGELDLIKPSGMIIFDMADSDYEQRRSCLNPGDKIVLYTDGVYEAIDDSGNIIGEERFYRMLSINSDLSPAELTEKIYSEIYLKEGYCIDDDFAILVAEYRG